MHEYLRLQEVIPTVQISAPERHLAQNAFQLLETVFHPDIWNPAVQQHLTQRLSSENATQAFWEFDNDDAHRYDRLAISLMPHHLIIATEHRDFSHGNGGLRASLSLYQESATAYSVKGGEMPKRGTSDPEAIQAFKNQFAQTTAQLGLAAFVKATPFIQKESEAASFASAA